MAKISKPKTIDEYLEGVSPDQRAALEELRRIIHEAAPGAEEVFSYGLPAFKLNGKVVAGFGTQPSHCAYYPFSGSIVEAHQAELRDYDTSKGSIRFQPDHPLPPALVKKLVRARIEENKAASQKA